MGDVIAGIAVCTCIVLYLAVQYCFLVPAPRGLRILMYHKASEERADVLTVKRDMLDRQFAYLVERGCTTVSFAQVLEWQKAGTALPPRSVVITFDDGYLDTYSVAFPLLVRYGLKATVFLVPGRIGGTSAWETTPEPLAGVRELREMAASGLVEFGLHSHEHVSYRTLKPEQMRDDVLLGMKTLNELGVPFVPVLSFPYGAFPREPHAKAAMCRALEAAGVRLAVRIGRRVNPWPIRDPYLLKRIIVDGNDRLFDFAVKFNKGRRKLYG